MLRKRQKTAQPQKNPAHTPALPQLEAIFLLLAVASSFPPRLERQSPDQASSEGGDFGPAQGHLLKDGAGIQEAGRSSWPGMLMAMTPFTKVYKQEARCFDSFGRRICLYLPHLTSWFMSEHPSLAWV